MDSKQEIDSLNTNRVIGYGNRSRRKREMKITHFNKRHKRHLNKHNVKSKKKKLKNN